MSAIRHYVVHGLHVGSELELPELCPLELSGGEPAVVIRRRDVPSDPDGSTIGWFHVRDGRTAIVHIEAVARFELVDGMSVDVEPLHGSDPAAVRAYLIGPIMRLILHQRGDLPLHVSAVMVDGRAWAFTGPAGTGKSTLAAGLHLHAGLPFLTDDVGVARPSGPGDAGAWLWPGPRFFKLRPDAFAGVRGVVPGVLRDFAGSEKVRVVATGETEPAPVRLAGIIVLQRSGGPGGPVLDSARPLDPVRLRGAEAFLAAQATVHDPRQAVALTPTARLFDRVAWLSSTVAFFRSPFPLTLDPASAERALAIVEELRALQDNARP
jgi:hypothetical protein